MSTIDWAKLTAPVPAEDIEWVEKAHGKRFAYMSAQFVRRRLDSVAQGTWSYECEHVPFVEGQPPAGDGEPFVVRGCIALGDDSRVYRASFGSGKNFKEAETDAFKRAAQRLGIGNELYEMGPNTQPQVDPITQRVPKAVPAQGLTEADKAVMRESINPTVKAAADEPPCPKCGGKVWDNRIGKKNPKAPDFRCRDKSCDGVVWPPKSGAAAPAKPASYASITSGLEEDGRPLPF